MMVELLRKKVEYQDKDGEERTATNFYVRCGNQLVPIEVKYFADKESGQDRFYGTRKTLLTAFAEELPDKEQSSSKNVAKKAKKSEVEEDDADIPFN